MSALTEQRVREIVREEIATSRTLLTAEQLAAPYIPVGKPFSPSVISAALQGQRDE